MFWLVGAWIRHEPWSQRVCDPFLRLERSRRSSGRHCPDRQCELSVPGGRCCRKKTLLWAGLGWLLRGRTAEVAGEIWGRRGAGRCPPCALCRFFCGEVSGTILMSLSVHKLTSAVDILHSLFFPRKKSGYLELDAWTWLDHINFSYGQFQGLLWQWESMFLGGSSPLRNVQNHLSICSVYMQDAPQMCTHLE